MKKLFAGIVAALALVPVVTNAASYKKGEYINFAGNDSDYSAFQAAVAADEYETYAENSGVGSIYMAAGHTGYLRVIPLTANISLTGGVMASTTGDIKGANTTYAQVAAELRNGIKSPYGYATTAANGIDVDTATLEEIQSTFGVTTENSTVELTDVNKAIFYTITARNDEGTYYIFTKTQDTNDATLYWALEVTKTSNEDVASVKLVKHVAAETGMISYIFPVVEMNEEYVCSKPTSGTYACYECTTSDNQTEYIWRLEGSQADTCKKSTKITSKAKCVKSPKTGVDSYLVPSAIVLGVCAIVLTVVKRKDAFKAI